MDDSETTSVLQEVMEKLEKDKSLKSQMVVTMWLIKTSIVAIDVRGYPDEIYDCVS